MLFATAGQLEVFLWMLASGAVIGAWYALTAAFRHLVDAGFWLSLAADTAFGVGAAAIFCAMLYAANYGALRLYELLAALAGFLLFAAGAFPPARALVRAGTRALGLIFVKIRQYRWIKVIFR